MGVEYKSTKSFSTRYLLGSYILAQIGRWINFIKEAEVISKWTF
jgi:hypothetical protein